jgi:ABC-type Fe3+ transport system substrate-binding protein
MAGHVLSSVLALLLVAACAPSAAPPVAPAQSAAAPAKPAAAPPPASAASPAPPAQGDTLQGLVEAARAEGQLNLMWTPSYGGRTGAMERWAEGFNKLYGLNVRVQFTPGPTVPEMLVRTTQEMQGGRAASSDVYLGADRNIVDALAAGVLLPVDWAAWAPNVQNPALLAPRGVAVGFASRTPGFTYNTNRVRPDELPTSFADLLKPQYKGRLAASVFAADHFELLASSEAWGEQRAIEYATRFADQPAGMIRCAEIERIATGEFDILAPDCGTFVSRQLSARGAPLAGVIPTDAAVLAYVYFAVPVNAAHPAAAKLWINYLLSREGQDILWETEFVDHHRVPGSKTAPEIEQLVAQGVKLIETDIPWYERLAAEKASKPWPDFERIVAGR